MVLALPLPPSGSLAGARLRHHFLEMLAEFNRRDAWLNALACMVLSLPLLGIFFGYLPGTIMLFGSMWLLGNVATANISVQDPRTHPLLSHHVARRSGTRRMLHGIVTGFGFGSPYPTPLFNSFAMLRRGPSVEGPILDLHQAGYTGLDLMDLAWFDGRQRNVSHRKTTVRALLLPSFASCLLASRESDLFLLSIFAPLFILLLVAAVVSPTGEPRREAWELYVHMVCHYWHTTGIEALPDPPRVREVTLGTGRQACRNPRARRRATRPRGGARDHQHLLRPLHRTPHRPGRLPHARRVGGPAARPD
ncbi:MAG: hypothetical protein SF028_05565 [Candidatus Sumerlaeia bacterium]|nr:hypothetical protein [Candidatus Sumerlaeia bacterium]